MKELLNIDVVSLNKLEVERGDGKWIKSRPHSGEREMSEVPHVEENDPDARTI
jgi:hypothetical protein